MRAVGQLHLGHIGQLLMRVFIPLISVSQELVHIIFIIVGLVSPSAVWYS